MQHDLDLTPNTPNSLPPQNVDAEREILGSILLDSDALARVKEILVPSQFYINAHRIIYETCLALHEKDLPTDVISVINSLSDRGLLEKVGGKAQIIGLLERTVTSINVDAMAAIVQGKARSRAMIAAGNEISRLGWDVQQDWDARLEAAEKRIFDLRQTKNTPNGGLQSLEEIILGGFYNELETETASSIATDFYDLDKLLGGGLNPSDLIIVGARPSMGKSAFACALAYKIAAKYQKPTLIFSLEMDAKSILRRYYSNLTGIEYDRLRSSNISIAEWEKVNEATAMLSSTNVVINHNSCPSISEIRSQVRSCLRKYGELNLIVLDYLQLMIDDPKVDPVQQLGVLTRAFKSMAIEYNVPVVVLSQLNRQLESRKDKRPTSADLRASGRIEEDGDVILFLYRDEYYNPDTPDRGLMEIICAKHRNGATGTVKLLFDGAHSRIQNYAGR